MKRNHEITLRVSKEELEKLKRIAEESGLPLSAYCRYVILNVKPQITYE